MSAVGRGKQVRGLNPVVAKSRRDRLGAVTLRKFSGPDNNAAYRTAKEFEERAGGREGVAEKIEALGDTAPAEMRELAKALRAEKPKKALSTILAERKVSLLRTMQTFQKGCVELAQIEAAIEMHRNLPPVVKDISRHALDQPGVCQQCLGTGTLRAKSTDNKETLSCRFCNGTGEALVSSPHKEWAAKAILNATGVERKAPGSQVNVAVGVNMAEGKSYSERVIDMADRVLHAQEPAAPAPDVVDAEVVDG
jgi:hypothetical protein